jgi:exonuclease III
MAGYGILQKQQFPRQSEKPVQTFGRRDRQTIDQGSGKYIRNEKVGISFLFAMSLRCIEPMKIVTWNCAGAFRKKHQALKQLNADILVIQECEDPAQSSLEYQDFAGEYLWNGKNKHKGIGIFAKNGHQLRKLRWQDRDLELFLPCRIDERFNLLGVWTKAGAKPKLRYIQQFAKYLQVHRKKLAKNSTVICGDFNSNTQWDKQHRFSNHSDVVEELEKIGLHSLYHQASNEAQGSESVPTFYLHKSKEKPYHIDYAFVPEGLLGKNELAIGDAAEWLAFSDHLPVSFTVPDL